MEMQGGAAEARREMAETLAIEALGFIAAEPDSLARFLAASGISPATLRRAAADPAFLAGILDFLLGDEPLLLAFASRAGIPPERIGEARIDQDHDGSAEHVAEEGGPPPDASRSMTAFASRWASSNGSRPTRRAGG